MGQPLDPLLHCHWFTPRVSVVCNIIRLIYQWTAIMASKGQPSLFSFFSRRVQPSASSDTDVQGQATPSTSTTEELQPVIDEPSPETPVNAERLSKKCRHDKFREGWLKDFSWLQTDQEITMLCSICLKSKPKKMASLGTQEIISTRHSQNTQCAFLTKQQWQLHQNKPPWFHIRSQPVLVKKNAYKPSYGLFSVW